VVCFLAQTIYPEHGLNNSLSGCSEDEKKLFSCMKLMDNSLVDQPQHCLLVKQAVAQQVQKIPTLYTAGVAKLA
jgi:hypothetical protein